MGDFFTGLFDTTPFPARWTCGQWTPAEGWLHILSDIGIWSAYTAIPIVLFYFVRKRKDLPFMPVFILFGIFIFSCGFGHLLEAGIFWWPAYRFAGLVKLCTALSSWLTVLALIRIAPAALALPGLAKVNRELSQANGELNDFAYVVSHDLKAPLRGIRSLTEWIETDLPERSGDTQKNLELLRDRVDRMEGLINGVLDYSRVGKQRGMEKSVNVAETVQDVVASIAVPENIHIEVMDELPSLRINPTKLFQIFSNLIENAVRHTGKKGGTIRIGAAETLDDWRFSVSDDGPGIAPEHQDRIFRIFQRIESGANAKEQTGIGLAIAKKIVQMRGGKIWIDSDVGIGSTFYFTIPKKSAGDFELASRWLPMEEPAS